MYIRSIGLFIAIFVCAATSFSQTHSLQVGMLDGSVRNTLQVEVKFYLPTDPGPVTVRMARLAASTKEACLASTNFSAAAVMSPRSYYNTYDAATGTDTFSFGVEREMKESGETGGTVSTCHVVRFSGSGVDGRDFLVWQISPSSSTGESLLTFEDVAARALAGEFERVVKVLPVLAGN